MDDRAFTQRKQKILELISQNQFSQASFLIRTVFFEINPTEIKQNSWLILTWLSCSIRSQDYEQAGEILELSQQRVFSFNQQQNIEWLQLRQELILSLGIDNAKQASQLLLIWRKLAPILASNKKWYRLENLSSTTFDALLDKRWSLLFWEPLLWWLHWSKNSRSLAKPSLEIILTIFDHEPSIWLLELIQKDLASLENDKAESINMRIQNRIKELKIKLSPSVKAFELNQSINQCILDNDQPKLLSMLEAGAPPNGYPNLQGAWWISLRSNSELAIIESLLIHGAWVNVRNEAGFSPLMISTNKIKLEQFRLLIKYGADPFMLTMEGQSLLHLAVNNNNLQLVQELLQMGFCPDSRDMKGRTARKIAMDLQLKEIIQVLNN